MERLTKFLRRPERNGETMKSKGSKNFCTREFHDAGPGMVASDSWRCGRARSSPPLAADVIMPLIQRRSPHENCAPPKYVISTPKGRKARRIKTPLSKIRARL